MNMTISVVELQKTLMDQHGWNRIKAGFAARFYLGFDKLEDLRFFSIPQPVHHHLSSPSLTQSDIEEIIRYR